MPPFLPIRAISRSQAVRVGGQTVKTESTTYVDLGANTVPYTPRKELRSHLALGAVVVVGALTGTNSDWVVDSGGVVTAEKNEAKAEAELAVSENQDRQRSTGTWVTSEALTKLKVKNSVAGKERIDLIYAIVEGAEAGKVKLLEGVAAVTGKAVAKETPAKAIAVATVKRVAEEPVVITDVRPRP